MLQMNHLFFYNWLIVFFWKQGCSSWINITAVFLKEAWNLLSQFLPTSQNKRFLSFSHYEIIQKKNCERLINYGDLECRPKSSVVSQYIKYYSLC